MLNPLMETTNNLFSIVVNTWHAVTAYRTGNITTNSLQKILLMESVNNPT